jgi:hypothetical protein
MVTSPLNILKISKAYSIPAFIPVNIHNISLNSHETNNPANKDTDNDKKETKKITW